MGTILKLAGGCWSKVKPLLSDYNFWLVIGTWVLAAIAYFALRDGSESLQRSQRAWVGPSSANIEGGVEINKPVIVQLAVLNTGREPAENFANNIYTGIWDTKTESAANFQAEVDKWVSSCKAKPDQPGAQVLFPTSGFGNGFNFRATYPKEKIDSSVISGAKILVMVGCVAYRTANTTRHTAFCYFFKNGVTKPEQLNICTTGNTAD